VPSDALNVVFNLQPSLQGESVQLRPLDPKDFHTLFAVACDPLIWEQHPENDRYKEDVFARFFREAIESAGALVAIDKHSGEMIGSSRFHGYDQEKSEVEIGWTFLARSHWGGLYNGEMKRLMLNHAFQSVETVLFVIGENNLRSRRAVEKLGATQAPCRPGRPGCKIVYQITAADWRRPLFK
jgi:N-acetyltransferase